MPQKGTEKRRSSENVISTDKSALLWMYCREIAPFETPTFSKKVGELIARATSTPQKRATYQRQIKHTTTAVEEGGVTPRSRGGNGRFNKARFRSPFRSGYGGRFSAS